MWKFLVFRTWLTFDPFLRPRSIYRLGIHPYEFWHMSRNNISISRIMYSKMPTKRKISIFFGFGWPTKTLQKRRKDNRLILMYKGLKGKARIPTDDLIPKDRRCRNQHSLVFQIPSASKDSYKKSFFPQTIRDWNALPDSLISSAELSDDCVSKFTSLVRARDYSSSAKPW